MVTALFRSLVNASSEEDVTNILNRNAPGSLWQPLGQNENNYGVIENQQASPIAALIEKITNSIDALLMRKCHEAGIDPRSDHAPISMANAIKAFYRDEQKNWHLPSFRRKQGESIQILASGSSKRPCLMIYDEGEGQHPDQFERTFLSLLRGNKNEISFVQGKYNMGGTGALVFCGKHRYQLIGSRRFDESGEFGFTLVRKHPLTEEEARTRKNTWYEFLKIDGRIPRFAIDELDLGLVGRKFRTGTIIKLYNYDLPSGTRGALPQEPRRAIDQFLFEPALPIYLVDSKERYPNNTVLQMDCFGLKRKLEGEDHKYVERRFSLEDQTPRFGKLKITGYVFRPKVDGRTVKETREIIQKEFFHDGMAILFSLNGQVHGHLTSEFTTRSLKMPLLKHHLLVHVDCTELNHEFRGELFMASRDRLKAGDDTAALRKHVAGVLAKSELAEIYKQRKNAISVEGGDAKDLLKAFSKNLPFNKELLRLLNQTFKIEQQDSEKQEKAKPEKPKVKKQEQAFEPKRYPSYFRLKSGNDSKYISIAAGDEKTIQFATDVEDEYFDRSDDPGGLEISILGHKRNEAQGGTARGELESPGTLLNVRKASPKNGTIRVSIGAASDLRVGDEIDIHAILGGPEDHEERFWVKITEPQQENKEVEKEDDNTEPPVGLPDYSLVYQTAPEATPDAITWDSLEASGVEMGFDTVMHPFVNGEGHLEKLFINMDSSVLRNYFKRLGAVSVEQKEAGEKRYISSIYFHSIFLFSITKSQNLEIKKGQQTKEVSEFLKDTFSSYYSDFLLNFGTEELMATLAD